MSLPPRKPIKLLKPLKPPAVGSNIAKPTRESHERSQADKLRRIDTEVLTIEGVAEYLHCSVASVRALSATDLPPREGPGRRLLFLREDILRYLLRGERQRAGISADMVREAEALVLESPPDSERRPSRRRTGK